MKMGNPRWLAGEGAEMADAMRAARACFDEFAREVELENWRIIPSHDSALIKAFFPNKGSRTTGEFLIVDEVSIGPDFVTGILASPSRMNPALAAGVDVTVPMENVCDWMLIVGEKGVGGFTIDVLKQRIRPEQMEAYESMPPVSWFKHRRTITAFQELAAKPICVSCGVRSLLDRPYREGVCGCCANGLKRCNCPKCGVPLFRAEGAAPECHACASGQRRKAAELRPWWQFW